MFSLKWLAAHTGSTLQSIDTIYSTVGSQLVNTLCLILMNITTQCDSTALFIFIFCCHIQDKSTSFSQNKTGSTNCCMQGHIQIGFPCSKGRRRHRHPCQHYNKGQKPRLINTPPGAQSHIFPRPKQLVFEKESSGSFRGGEDVGLTHGHFFLIITLHAIMFCSVLRPGTAHVWAPLKPLS